MQENLNKNQMDDLANEGWAQMKDLLQMHGLEEKKKPGVFTRRALKFGAIAACILLFIGSYLFLSTHINEPQTLVKTEENKLSVNNSNRRIPEKKINNKPLINEELTESENVTSVQIKNNQEEKSDNPIYKNILYSPKTIVVLPLGQKEKINQIILTSFAPKLDVKRETKVSYFQNPGKIQSWKEFSHPKQSIKENKDQIKRPIAIFAGGGLNISGKRNDQPSLSLSRVTAHPSVKVILPVNKKLSIHTGLYAFSTITAKEASSKEKEIVNNLTANLHYKINTASIIKTSYFDVPVTINFHLTKNLSVGGGLEISRLFQYDVKEKEESYDFQNNLTATSEERYRAMGTFSTPTTKNKIIIKKWEPRLLLETNLQKGAFLFSAGYHYGLSPSITIEEPNGVSNHFKNEYFKVGVQYQLK